ncbi:MAG: hypothetical protein ACLP9L_18235 [Thermoguttaceae bacterium]
MGLGTSQSGSVQTIVSLDGVSCNQSLSPAGNTICKPTAPLPAANAGTLTTRTSNTQGVFTFTAAAPIQGTETIALFWPGGYVYDATINSFTGTAGAVLTVTFTVPGGQTALPAASTAGQIATAQDVTNSVSIVGADVQQLLITSTQPGICELLDATPAQQRLSVIAAAGAFDSWAGGSSPPWTDTVVKARMYNNSLTTATMTVVALLA